MTWLSRYTVAPGGLPVDRATGLVDGLALRRVLAPGARGGRLLFRVEPDSPGGAVLLAQTGPRPADRPPGPALISAGEPWDVDAELAAVVIGDVLRYRIVANPTRHNGPAADAVRRDRMSVLHGAAAGEWWRARAGVAGLRPLAGTATALPDLVGGHGLRHGVTRFDGTAEVYDAGLLRAAVTAGVGRARNYGCGLLTVARASG